MALTKVTSGVLDQPLAIVVSSLTGAAVATAAEMRTSTAGKVVSADLTKYSPYAVKAWGFFQGGDGAFLTGYGATTSRTSTGDYNITFSPSFTQNYACIAIPMSDASVFARQVASGYGWGVSRIIVCNTAGTPTDPNYVMFIACGPM